ncbi:Neoxanthin-deficient [Thalictrum thalictroides]|uniref:Neoxanthin-deficient n=1 Tax=Thalictrum thalictroides TaxID=46969 RepID=A0A7J6WQV3_THATH|nr:Neoxanthin-deficient [Thalictrum thalictroides]
MDAVETKSPTGFLKPPWLFKGSALYQLHLVKAATARTFIPKEFRLVEAFGYTLGGFFLAQYEDSPFGMFDELVVIAGIVWNPPTSCAWAARVLVNSHGACLHGRKDVGLPSHHAGFSKRTAAIKRRDTSSDFLNSVGAGYLDIRVSEINDSSEVEFCSMKLPTSVSLESTSGKSWMGPLVKMALPSFSGKTEYNPQLLKYSCQIECRVRPVKIAKVSGQIPTVTDDREESSDLQSSNSINSPFAGLSENETRQRSISVLLSKPLLALQFSFLRMQVEAPTVVVCHSKMQ